MDDIIKKIRTEFCKFESIEGYSIKYFDFCKNEKIKIVKYDVLSDDYEPPNLSPGSLIIYDSLPFNTGYYITDNESPHDMFFGLSYIHSNELLYYNQKQFNDYIDQKIDVAIENYKITKDFANFDDNIGYCKYYRQNLNNDKNARIIGFIKRYNDGVETYIVKIELYGKKFRFLMDHKEFMKWKLQYG